MEKIMINKDAVVGLARKGKSECCVLAQYSKEGTHEQCLGDGSCSPKASMCRSCRKEYPSGSKVDVLVKNCIRVARTNKFHTRTIAQLIDQHAKGETPGLCVYCGEKTENADDRVCLAHVIMYGVSMVDVADKQIQRRNRQINKLSKKDFDNLVKFSVNVYRSHGNGHNEETLVSAVSKERKVTEKVAESAMKVARQKIEREDQIILRQEFTREAFLAKFVNGACPVDEPFLSALRDYQEMISSGKSVSESDYPENLLFFEGRPITEAMIKKTCQILRDKLRPDWFKRGGEFNTQGFLIAKRSLGKAFSGSSQISEEDVLKQYNLWRENDEVPTYKGWHIHWSLFKAATKIVNNQILQNAVRKLNQGFEGSSTIGQTEKIKKATK